MYKSIVLLCLLLVTHLASWCQLKVQQEIAEMEEQLLEVNQEDSVIRAELEELKLEQIRYDLEYNVGLPVSNIADQVVMHSAMAIGYSETHEQAEWVSHIITPDIVYGNKSRTNDFRPDSLITTGTPVTEDYWNSGFDRGHLAPSADFRWSQRALSESYFYSNMSPQRPGLNREIWAELESKLRGVVIRENVQLYVVTGGILQDSLANIGVQHEVSVPEWYYKVALDVRGKKGIAFLIPNRVASLPLRAYAVSIDSIEEVTGIDFFPRLTSLEQKHIEGEGNIDLWLDEKEQGEAVPIDMELLPSGYVNTQVVKYHMDRKIGVCGKVVSTKYHEPSGGTFLNLDRKFPHQVFSVTIWKDSRTNFSYLPEHFLLDKEVCITGMVRMNRGTPTMNIEHEKQIRLLKKVIK